MRPTDARTVVVTGAAGGIGGSIAAHIAGLGYHVVATDIDGDKLSELQLGAAGSLDPRPLDIANEEQVSALFAEPELRAGLVGVVLCAGATRRATLLESTTADTSALVQTNLLGTYFCLRAAAEAFADRGGSIVVITSINAIRALPTQAVYSATKAALQSMVASAAVELGPRGIRVNAIAPGAVLTEMNPGLELDSSVAEDIPLRRVGRSSDMNGAAAFLLGDTSSYITGTTVVVDGGLLHVR